MRTGLASRCQLLASVIPTLITRRVTYHSAQYSLKMTLEELIEEIRQYPCLWNKGLEEYRNQNMRDNAWAMISGELNTPGNVQILLFYL